jgi:hypothetical protein
MRLLNYALSCAAISVAASACDSDSNGSLPTSASPTTSAIAVTVNSPIKVDETAQATATASLSNGQSQAITTGWQSDAPNVASVTPAGIVTGVANGRATIYVIAGGRQGQQVVRVVPNYEGQWAGLLRVTSCSQTGTWAQAGFCDEFRAGTVDGFALGLSQTGESLTARASYGPSIIFPPVTSMLDADGAAAFTATFRDTAPPGLVIAAAWRMSSAARGSLSGTVTETWTIPGIPGEGRLVQDIVSAGRAGASSSSRSDGKSRAMGARFRRMR